MKQMTLTPLSFTGTLNLTIPTLPATGCTLTVQVTSAVLGSNANATSGVTSVQTAGAGAVSNTAYLTVSPVDVGFSYVHADHLGTPRAITRPSDNAKVWEWKNDEPFGNNAPNENPSGAGAFSFNLRFPGQYADVETGTNYNYYRDFDPATGRYIQSDPIGLTGGINTYAYVRGNPLRFVDPYGLQVLPFPIPPPPVPAPGPLPGFGDEPKPGFSFRPIRVPRLFPNWMKSEQQCQDEKEECRKDCADTLERDEAECIVVKAGYGKAAQAICLGKAKDFYAKCLRKCDGK